jgi:UDP-galactose transporter B1
MNMNSGSVLTAGVVKNNGNKGMGGAGVVANRKKGKAKKKAIVKGTPVQQKEEDQVELISLNDSTDTNIDGSEESKSGHDPEQHAPIAPGSVDIETSAQRAKNPSGAETTNINDPPPYGEAPPPKTVSSELNGNNTVWLVICFMGIMASFVVYGLLLEYTTSGGRQLHELSFLFITSLVYTLTAAAGRYVRDETPTSIPPARFAVLGLTSMGSTFCSVRSLRYVIYPIQVLAKSCKPVPVMLMGALMGKQYPPRKYFNVCLIVVGVGLFMGGGDKSEKKHASADAEGEERGSGQQIVGIMLLFISLCFDGGTGAYEDKLMSVHHVGPFDLMYNIQLGKTILAGVSLLILNQVHVFLQMVSDMGFLLVALGLSGAMGQVFIFVTISKFGALTCSIIGLARKVTTLVASIYFYGHVLNATQLFGLAVCIGAMTMNFTGKKKADGGHGHGPPPADLADQGANGAYTDVAPAEEDDDEEGDEESPLVDDEGGVEMKQQSAAVMS